jgi:hypothetical protein
MTPILEACKEALPQVTLRLIAGDRSDIVHRPDDGQLCPRDQGGQQLASAIGFS